MHDLDAAVGYWLHIVGNGIEIFGVLVIVLGIGCSTFLYVGQWMAELHYATYKIRIGRSLLLGLEVLVAADIVKTIALDLTFTSLGLLAGLVLIRTFLSWTLVLEIEGSWPWQRGKHRP
jgi:uncharacterized membrane protein